MGNNIIECWVCKNKFERKSGDTCIDPNACQKCWDMYEEDPQELWREQFDDDLAYFEG